MSESGQNFASITLEERATPVPTYTLVKKLGEGGYGQVWKAEGPGGFEVALKFVRLGAKGQIESRSLELLKAVRNPNLLTPFGSWEIGGYLIIGMDLADGSLKDRLDEAKSQGHQGVPHEELIEYMVEAAKGLDYLNAHRHDLVFTDKITNVKTIKKVGIQHRDLKPENIMLSGGGVKVADFGLSRLLENSVTGHTGSMSFQYAAPEYFNQQTSDFSDQYSLAITYCVLRSGIYPFRGNNEALCYGHLFKPPDLEMLPDSEKLIVARALSKDPQARWPNCRAFVDQLRVLGPQPAPFSSAEGDLLPPPPTVISGSQPRLEIWSENVPTELPPVPEPPKVPKPRRRAWRWRPVLRASPVLLLGLGALWYFEVLPEPIVALLPRIQFFEGIPANVRKARTAMGRGIQAYNASDYNRAVAEFDLAIRLNPILAEAHDGRGLAYKALGKSDRAISDFGMAIQLDPKHVSSYNNRANTYQALSEYSKALEDYNQALVIDPKNKFAFNNRGNTYMAMGRALEAIEDFTRAIDLDRKYASAYNGRASAFHSRGENERAIDDYTVAIRLEPRSAQYHRNRAIIYAEMGRTSKAKADEKQAERLQ